MFQIKKIDIAIFDNLDLQNYFFEIDDRRYPRATLLLNYEENDSIEQYKDLKLFLREYICELLLNPFISYADMKTNTPSKVIDLRHQLEHITPKKVKYFKNMALILIMLDYFQY